ncbi:hypothetical protein EES45_23115 [Streptomyces sp. ADI97-07]|uniref:hypothetical protein n=1 Tax=Streptomyces sp. ADI97-07 TaxID=1522762 RepID=UPI000FB61182|nr:hypothetical protein [Streptomyces sp. ADI97-07]RPK76385.1 hypothetical protein EES45_23115 [Streptomyces sp. ADI97-07]
MPFFVVDDGADSHPKMLRAKNAAVGLWTRVGSYVARQLTDGYVPGEIAAMYGSAPQIRKLVAVRLWHEHGHTCPRCPQPRPGDYYMHDYAESGNPSRAEVQARREKAAEKKRLQRGGAPKRPAAPAPNPLQFDDDEPPADAEDAPPEDVAPPARTPRPAAASIAPDWEPSPDDVHAAQVARADAGRSPLTADQVDAVTRKFVRRQLDDDARAVAWGGRWRQWAESERPEPPTGAGGVVVQFAGRGPAGAPPQSTADQRAAAAFALAAELRAEGNQ